MYISQPETSREKQATQAALLARLLQEIMPDEFLKGYNVGAQLTNQTLNTFGTLGQALNAAQVNIFKQNQSEVPDPLANIDLATGQVSFKDSLSLADRKELTQELLNVVTGQQTQLSSRWGPIGITKTDQNGSSELLLQTDNQGRITFLNNQPNQQQPGANMQAINYSHPQTAFYPQQLGSQVINLPPQLQQINYMQEVAHLLNLLQQYQQSPYAQNFMYQQQAAAQNGIAPDQRTTLNNMQTSLGESFIKGEARTVNPKIMKAIFDAAEVLEPGQSRELDNGFTLEMTDSNGKNFIKILDEDKTLYSAKVSKYTGKDGNEKITLKQRKNLLQGADIESIASALDLDLENIDYDTNSLQANSDNSFSKESTYTGTIGLDSSVYLPNKQPGESQFKEALKELVTKFKQECDKKVEYEENGIKISRAKTDIEKRDTKFTAKHNQHMYSITKNPTGWTVTNENNGAAFDIKSKEVTKNGKKIMEVHIDGQDTFDAVNKQNLALAMNKGLHPKEVLEKAAERMFHQVQLGSGQTVSIDDTYRLRASQNGEFNNHRLFFLERKEGDGFEAIGVYTRNGSGQFRKVPEDYLKSSGIRLNKDISMNEIRDIAEKYNDSATIIKNERDNNLKWRVNGTFGKVLQKRQATL